MLQPVKCMHCKREASVEDYRWSRVWWFRVVCTNMSCFSRGPERRTRHGAVKAWNRQNAAEVFEALRTSEQEK
jgi:hypothetical protein